MLERLERQKKLTANQWPIILTTNLGDMLDFFDFFLIGYVLAFILKEWHLTYGQSAIILISRGLGAVPGAFFLDWMGDRIGRRTVFMLTGGAEVKRPLHERGGRDCGKCFGRPCCTDQQPSARWLSRSTASSPRTLTRRVLLMSQRAGFGKAFGHDDGPCLTIDCQDSGSARAFHACARISADLAHLRTKLRCFFKPIRALIVQEGPMVRIRLPPAASHRRSGEVGGCPGTRAMRALLG
jgi:hypothetical protein